ncbi:hypothetical protein E2562_012622, partial [Oryza meyeriana var. granulata]
MDPAAGKQGSGDPPRLLRRRQNLAVENEELGERNDPKKTISKAYKGGDHFQAMEDVLEDMEADLQNMEANLHDMEADLHEYSVYAGDME